MAAVAVMGETYVVSQPTAVRLRFGVDILLALLARGMGRLSRGYGGSIFGARICVPALGP